MLVHPVDYALLAYLSLSSVACASCAAVFYVAYYPQASQPLQRWFLILLGNTAATAALVFLQLAPRMGGGDALERVLQLCRSVAVCLNAFLVPHFIHAFLPPAKAGPASGFLAGAAFAAAILEIAGLPRVAGMVLGLAVLYGFVLGLVLVFRMRRSTPPDPDGWVLRTVLIVSACVLPGLFLQLASGYRILVWRQAARVLRFELTPPLMAVASLVLLLRLRAHPPGVSTPGMRVPDRLLEELSSREREVVEQVLQGRTNREISDALFIAESTVKKHVNGAFRKLHITSRWQLLKLQNGRE